MAADPVLTLTTASETQRLVRINNKSYALREAADLGLHEMRQIDRDGRRAVLLEARDSFSKQESDEYGRLMTSLCRVGLDAPVTVIDGLNDLQKMAVVVVFLGYVVPTLQRMLVARGPQMKPAQTKRAASRAPLPLARATRKKRR